MVTLVVIFNHAFPDNIPILRQILRERFDDVLFVQPILRSSDPDVLTSYRGSFNFHGMIADHGELLLARKSSHYIFIQDDVLLNPRYNQKNIIDALGVGRDEAFITSYGAAGGQINGIDYTGWIWIVGVLWKMHFPTNTICGSGVQSFARDLAEVSSRVKGIEERHGLNFQPFTYDERHELPLTDPFGGNALNQELVRTICKGIFGEGERASYTPPVPLCAGYSDFFVVDRSLMGQLIHYLGVFAAANVFVEVAIPSALTYCASRIVQAGDRELRVDWSYEESKTSTQELIEQFRSNLLIVHPVKPSREAERMKEIARAFA